MTPRITNPRHWIAQGLAIYLGTLASSSVQGEQKPLLRPLPGALQAGEISEFDDLDPKRRSLVELALKAGREHRLNRYLFGSADPKQGGFDCSGAMYFILKQAGMKPARSSAAQYDWINEAGLLLKVPIGVQAPEAAAFESLKPGDLVFWSGTYHPTDGRTNKVTHVQMYLGTETKTGKPVMIGSSDGRSYQGTARCGFGIFDFKIPSKGSKARIVGYGPPPGLVDNSEK